MSTSSSPQSQSSRLQALLAQIKAKKAAENPEPILTPIASTIIEQVLPEPIRDPNQITDKYGNLITLNSKQSEFVSLASRGNSCVLIGAAGTGKTTCQKAVVAALIHSGIAGILDSAGHKSLISGTPGIVICAYTRRAVANIRRNMPEDLQNNCITIHKLLEYEPTYYTVVDPVSGEDKTKMSFEPARGATNPLPSSIHTVIIEECSMLGTDLHAELMAACPHNPQVIYLGDIQQLPPVFGPAILGFKLLELPVVELTEVYRQALESPIISLAHRILSGNPITKDRPSNSLADPKSSEHRRAFLTDGFQDWKVENQLTIHPWKKKLHPVIALQTAAHFFTNAADQGLYDPEEDIILIPFNQSFGTIELNKFIANHLARKQGRTTYEIVAGFKKHYYSPGDKVMYDKADAIVVSIESNPVYTGARPTPESTTLDYWGNYTASPTDTHKTSEADIELILSQVASADGEDRVKSASHKIKLRLLDSDTETTIDSAGAINKLDLGYALTVHKSQGSEWRKVFFVLHQSHAAMIQRELLYTGVTRAREELYVICEPETFVKGILSQRVKGNTLAEKAEYFKGKLTEREERIM